MRTAYEALPLVGLRALKVNTLAAISAGERVFLGTADGALHAYECRSDTPSAVRAGSFECQLGETLRRPGAKEKKAVTDLLAVEAWRALLGVMDGQVVAYDLYTYRPLASVPETKGAISLCVDEGARLIYAATAKKKLQILAWQAVGVTLKREVTLPEAPRAMACVPPAAAATAAARADLTTSGVGAAASQQLVVAFRKDYSTVDLSTGGVTILLTLTEQEQAAAAAAAAALAAAGGGSAAAAAASSGGGGGASAEGAGAIVLPLRAAGARGRRVLVAAGARGVLLDLSGRQREERLTWSAPPLAALATGPFLAALLLAPGGRVEVHDLASLAPVQTLEVGSGASCLAACPVGGGRAELAFVGGATGVTLLKMVPVEFQVQALVDAGSYEDALSLCELCRDSNDPTLLGSLDVSSIHERYAFELFSWGDYDGAVAHFLLAATPLRHVIGLFPSLIPPDLPSELLHGRTASGGGGGPGGGGGGASRPLTGTSLSRAAGALVRFLEKQRPAVKEAADRAEAAATGASAAGGVGSGRATTSLSSNASSLAASAAAVSNAEGGASADADALQQAVLVDTLLVAARMQCSPARRDAIVNLLSGGGSSGGGGSSSNRCHVDAMAPLLAAGGPPFIEALLWLYRGRGQHRRALALMTEERCVGANSSSGRSGSSSSGGSSGANGNGSSGNGGGWTQAEFRRWAVGYLRSLWLSDDPTLPPLVLPATRPLLESDPELGLSVFCSVGEGEGGGSGGGSSGGGSGRGAATGRRQAMRRPGGKGVPPADVVSFLKSVVVSPAGAAAAATAAAAAAAGNESLKGGAAVPLTSGRALAIRYLEQLVGVPSNAASGSAAATQLLTAVGATSVAAALPLLHDELAYLLLEGLLAELEAEAPGGVAAAAPTVEAAAKSGANSGGSAASLAGVYRRRLQAFLQTSQHYNPARLLAVVPTHFLQEHALLLSRLGRHEEVLRIYVCQLKDTALAERYCDRIWRGAAAVAASAAAAGTAQVGPMAAASGGLASAAALAADDASRAREDQSVYLSLAKVLLDSDNSASSGASSGGSSSGGISSGAGGKGLEAALSLLERNFARVDAVRVLSTLLPPSAPLSAAAPLLRLCLRHADGRRRSFAVARQLARADYVNVRFELVQLQARVSKAPEMALSFAHLGRLLRSCPPVGLTDASADYSVSCVKHIFEGHVVLEFNVTNHMSDHRLANVVVHVEAPEAASPYAVKSERALPALPPYASGACYTVLTRLPQAEAAARAAATAATGASTTAAAAVVVLGCELRLRVVRVSVATGQATGDPEGFPEDFPLEDLELAATDLALA